MRIARAGLRSLTIGMFVRELGLMTSSVYSEPCSMLTSRVGDPTLLTFEYRLIFVKITQVAKRKPAWPEISSNIFTRL